MAVRGLIRAVHTIGIELAGANSVNPTMPHVTSAVACGIQINHPGDRGIFRMIKQLQPNAARMSAEARTVHSFATCVGVQRQWDTHSNLSTLAYRSHILLQRASDVGSLIVACDVSAPWPDTDGLRPGGCSILFSLSDSLRSCRLSSFSRSRLRHRCQRMGATSRGTATPAQCGMMRAV
jgi:hypothetical protein